MEVDPSEESAARNWLKKRLPRRAKVNLHPVGSSDGVLIARVNSIDKNQDMSKAIAEEGFGNFFCDANLG